MGELSVVVDCRCVVRDTARRTTLRPGGLGGLGGLSDGSRKEAVRPQSGRPGAGKPSVGSNDQPV
jgi:hypothetical protein